MLRRVWIRPGSAHDAAVTPGFHVAGGVFAAPSWGCRVRAGGQVMGFDEVECGFELCCCWPGFRDADDEFGGSV